MREYELIYVIQPDAAPEREQQIHDRIDGHVQGGQGRVLVRDDWGKRKLAYEIRKFQKGHYFQLNFLGDGKFIDELERDLRLDADVIRFLTVLIDERVADIEARLALAEKQAAEQAKRREEREKLEAERAAELAEQVRRSEAEAGESPESGGAEEASAAPEVSEESDATVPELEE